MKKLPVGIQNFKEIIEGDYVYVDKTKFIYEMINGAKYYFLSRPRRFGKSLLLDTIAEVFKGDRDLFKGLWIHDSGYDFEAHPVIHLDMSSISNKTPEVLETALLDEISIIMKSEGIEIASNDPASVFKSLIRGLNSKYDKRVVVLIDEYDKPILDHLTDIPTAEANRRVVRGFYGILKSMDRHLRFTFFTGVTKFTKTSMFSELNNLTDITMIKDYASICGIPVESLSEYFGEHIGSLVGNEWLAQYEDIQAEILRWYDGYSWDGVAKLLNPFSLLSFFKRKEFYGFWYASGSPRFLIDHIKRKQGSYTEIEDIELTEAMLDAVDIDEIMITPLLFQTGYLTVKEKQPSRYAPVYIVDMPNYEVREAFNMHILSAFAESDLEQTGRVRMQIDRALLAGDLQKMLEVLRGFLASIPYELHVPLEAYYHTIFYALMTVLGFDMDVEVSMSTGRVDAVLELEDKVYVMEFKYVSCPKDAAAEQKQALFEKALDEGMEQINDRGYHKKYIGSGKEITLAAFAFLGRDDIEMRVESKR